MYTWVLKTRHGRVLSKDKEALLWHKRIYKYIWYKDLVGQRYFIDFCIVSADLFFSVVDICFKKEAELSTNNHLAVLNHRKQGNKDSGYEENTE